MSTALFSSAGISRSKNLVEFKAGKMTMKGKMVQPDKRKGLVYIYQTDDMLMHFCWKDRGTGVVEDDLMIFPEDIETRRVTQCTTGRVYLMKFKSSNKKMFFWMQEPDSEKDEKLWRKLNELLNNPPTGGSSSSSASLADRNSVAAGLANAFGADFEGLGGLLGPMSQQQLQMIFGGLMPANSPSSNRSGASSTISSNQTSRAQSTTSASRAEPASTSSNNVTSTAASNQQSAASSKSKSIQASDPSIIAAKPATTSTAPAGSTPTTIKEEPGTGQKIQLSDLQSILGNLASGAGGYGRAELDLSEILSVDIMSPILANKSVQEKLMQYLPESEALPKSEEELRSTMSTPQFKRAMSSFGSALQSGQLGPLMQQFGLPEEVSLAAAQGNLEAFAKAMEAYAKTKKEKKSGDEDDDQMDTK